jgi:hypothetical protein
MLAFPASRMVALSPPAQDILATVQDESMEVELGGSAERVRLADFDRAGA